MGRKRNQGKARKAAKEAKARQEADERRKNNNQTANNGSGQNDDSGLTAEGRRRSYEDALIRRAKLPCIHGAMPVIVGVNDVSCRFVTAFAESYHNTIVLQLWERFAKARDATMNEFADVWRDSAMIKEAMSYLLCDGVQLILEGSCNLARETATFARWLEQYIAVDLKQTQALYNWPKIEETYYADLHTLVKFFRHRIPCSCLDEKYHKVKQITKIGGCINPECSVPHRELERSKTKYCSRCRNVTYCSRECQVADWSRHKPHCDWNAAMVAEFEAEQQKG